MASTRFKLGGDKANPGLVLNLTTIIAEDEDEVAPTAHLIDGLQNRMFLDLFAGRGIPEDVLDKHPVDH
jgi:hypothetical protein